MANVRLTYFKRNLSAWSQKIILSENDNFRNEHKKGKRKTDFTARPYFPYVSFVSNVHLFRAMRINCSNLPLPACNQTYAPWFLATRAWKDAPQPRLFSTILARLPWQTVFE